MAKPPPQQLESQRSLWSLLKRKALELEIQGMKVVCHLHNVQTKHSSAVGSSPGNKGHTKCRWLNATITQLFQQARKNSQRSENSLQWFSISMAHLRERWMKAGTCSPAKTEQKCPQQILFVAQVNSLLEHKDWKKEVIIVLMFSQHGE